MILVADAQDLLALRRILGPVRLCVVRAEVGRPYYQAETALEVLDLLDEASEGGSNWSQQWTRSQPIRTAARLPFVFPILVASELFPYQRIAAQAMRLTQLGLSATAVAGVLGVTDKTVAKALRHARQPAAICSSARETRKGDGGGPVC